MLGTKEHRDQEQVASDFDDGVDVVATRWPEDVFADLDSLEQLIESLNRAPAIPEHPEVRAISGARPVRTQPCPVCTETQARPLYSIEGVVEQLVVCESCGLGSLSPLSDSKRIGDFYPAEYYGSPTAKFEPLVEYGVRLGARLRVCSLVSGLDRGSKVLDMGCGRGVMLRALLDLGHEADGVEISSEAAAGADPRAEICIAPDLADAEYQTDSFDAVILWHVLEHLPHPERTLEELNRIIRPGGRWIVAVPNFASWQARRTGSDWFHLDLPRHLYHFTPQTLTGLASRYGFECHTLRHFALLQNPFGWLQSWLNSMSGAPRNSLYTMLHRESTSESTRLSAGQQFLLRSAYLLGLPVAGAVSLVEAALRRGRTIALTAQLGDRASSTKTNATASVESALAESATS